MLQYRHANLAFPEKKAAISQYLKSLLEMGLHLEIRHHTQTRLIYFVLIYAPLDVLAHYAATFDVKLSLRIYRKMDQVKIWPKFLKNEITAEGVYTSLRYEEPT